MIHFYLKEINDKDKVSLEILEEDGDLIKKYRSGKDSEMRNWCCFYLIIRVEGVYCFFQDALRPGLNAHHNAIHYCASNKHISYIL